MYHYLLISNNVLATSCSQEVRGPLLLLAIASKHYYYYNTTTSSTNTNSIALAS